MSPLFPHLFSRIKLGQCELKNRIVSTGHHTYLADREPGEALVAYHAARARGGVGLIVSEIVAVHETAKFAGHLLTINQDTDLDTYRRLADACHEQDCRLFAQLFHPGREILSSGDGLLPVAWAPSAVANERFHIRPRPMPAGLIREIINGFADSAHALAAAGFDGVEIVASHGYLPAQFLSPAVNRRDDEYGGDFERRLSFVQQCIDGIRQRAPELALGLRLSANDYEPEGLDETAVAEICVAVDDAVDYFSLVAGSSATLGASVHITPPMGVEPAYVAPLSEIVRNRVNKPVIVSGRINQPQEAERIIATGQADLCGMTRAMICDPQMPAKAKVGQVDAIRACIACNQSCIGRAHKGLGISCLQNPVSGRELTLGRPVKPTGNKRVLIVGGGPAGMQAAVTCASRGHRVSLYEKSARLGGQVLLAQGLPGREEFGGLITNLEYELEQSAVECHVGVEVNPEMIQQADVDRVILATGGRCYLPDLPMLDESMLATYEQILLAQVRPGNRVVVADWRGDWTGPGLAEKLAREGCRVSLYVNAAMAGESLQMYTRNHTVGRLYKLDVEIVLHARLFGADQGSVFFQNTLSDEPVVVDDVDTLVLAMGAQSESALGQALEATGIDYIEIGDCVAPRSAEEAIYEAYTAATEVD